VILTPFFTYSAPRRSFCSILPRRRVVSVVSLGPPPELIEPSTSRPVPYRLQGGLGNGESVQGFFYVVPNSLMPNLHDFSAYSSDPPYALAPFFLSHCLGDYDLSTDINPTLYTCCTPATRTNCIKTVSPHPAMTAMTFAFYPSRDPYSLPNSHSLPPSMTAPTSLYEPTFPANYDP
jgi:hypothetical protein